MALSPLLRKSVSEAKNKYSRSDGKRIKPKEGRNVYRFLAPSVNQAPWVGPTGKFWAELGVHWIKPQPNGKPIAVVGSRDVCYQEPCPIGTAVDMALQGAHDEQTKKIYEEWKVTKSILFNVIDRTTNPDNQEVEIVELKPSAAQQVWDLMEQYDDAGQDLCDLANGVDLVVSKSGKGMNTEYTVNVKPGESKPVKADTLAKCHDLPDHIQKEFFKGDEQKALTAIQQIAGIALPKFQQLGAAAAQPALTAQTAAAATPTPALQSQAVMVDGAVMQQSQPVAQPEIAVQPVRQEVAQPVQQQEVAQTQQQVNTTVAPSDPTQTAGLTSTLSAADFEDVMSQLDNI